MMELVMTRRDGAGDEWGEWFFESDVVPRVGEKIVAGNLDDEYIVTGVVYWMNYDSDTISEIEVKVKTIENSSQENAH